jgi:hypothetical protein
MDGQRFDRLTRRLAGTTSRRGSLRLLAAAGAMVWGLTRGKGEAAAQSYYRSAGEPCWDDDQCVAADTALVCADNGTFEDGTLNCCAFVGSRCGADTHCCGRDICVNGFCQASSGASNVPPSYGPASLSPGDPCQTTAQCNRDVTGAICEFTTSTGDSRCCWYEGSFCTSSAQCCGSRVCSGGICQLVGSSDSSGGGGSCNWEGCSCMLYRDPACRANCPLLDPCAPGLTCTARRSDDLGICVRR